VTAKDYEAILHLEEPIVLVVVPLGPWCLLLSVILKLTALGEIAPHHCALFQGVLRWAPMIGAWFF
jgi:hypothetical protein